MNKKDLAGMLYTALLLMPAVAYFISEPGFSQFLIQDLGTVKNFTVVANEKENSHFIIEISGSSSSGSQLRVDTYCRDSIHPAFYKKVLSQIVSLPAGEIHDTLEKSFYPNSGIEKLDITYMPSSPLATGYLHLKTGIF